MLELTELLVVLENARKALLKTGPDKLGYEQFVESLTDIQELRIVYASLLLGLLDHEGSLAASEAMERFSRPNFRDGDDIPHIEELHSFAAAISRQSKSLGMPDRDDRSRRATVRSISSSNLALEAQVYGSEAALKIEAMVDKLILRLLREHRAI